MAVFREQLLAVFKSEDRPLIRQYYPLFPVFMIITVVMMWLEGYLQALNKSALQNFIREILLRLINIALVLLFAADIIGFSLFINLYVLLYIIPLIALIYLARKNEGFRFGGALSLLSPTEKKEIYRFSSYHMLGVVSIVLVFQMDALLIPPFSQNGLEDVAVYSIAVFGVALMRNPARVIGIAATPSFTQTYNEGRIRDLSRLYFRSSVNMQIIALVMFLLIALNLDNGMRILAVIKPGYELVKPLVLILMIGQIIEMGAGPNFELIGVTRYYRFNFWIALGLLGVIIALNIVLIKAIGLTGAAWATTIGLVLFNIVKALFLWKKLKIQPLGKSTAVIAGIGLVVGLVVWLLPTIPNVYWDIVLRTVVTGLLLWIMLYKSGVSPELNELTRNILFKRRLF